MNTKNIATIASVALGTATLTVLTFWSGSLDAGNEQEDRAAKIAKPKLVANGVEMTLATAGAQTFKAGDEPVFELQAVNTTDESATVAVLLAMTASSPEDMRSRVLRLPSNLWQHQQTLVLNPSETKVITISTQTKLPAKQLFSVAIKTVDPLKNTAAANLQVRPGIRSTIAPQSGIVALNFSTVIPVAQPSLASAR